MAAVKRTLPAPPELQSRWASVLEEAGRRPDILALSDRFPEERSLTVAFSDVDRVDTGLADVLLERPDEVLNAGQRAMVELLPVAGREAEGLRLRVTGLPATAHRLIREIRESDLNHLVALDGIVRRVTEVRPQIRDAVFQCVACRTEFHEPQDEASMVFREPLECPESQGGCGKPAGRTRFRLLPEKSAYVDAQRIEIQENPEILKHGAHPQGLAVMLTEDLTGQVLPGNRVVLNGVLKSFQRASASRGGLVRNTTFDLLVLGNSVEWKQQEYDEIEISPDEERLFLGFRGDPTVVDKIVMSLAPSIRGMEEEKEAIALQLFGGVEKRHPDGVRVRGDIHVLLVGDPGVAKSQLLRYIADVAPRGIYTSGKGATAAGLTAAAVKDDFAGGRWVLEAGMLVLADGGMAVIDELDKMTPEDRSATHETLEQQSYPRSFELMLANGEKRPIGDLVDALLRAHPERVVPGRDCEILPLEPGTLALLSTDFRGLRTVPADRVSRHAAPPHFVRVTWANGRSVTVTPEHPLFVRRDGRWTTVAAAEARPGDLAPAVAEYPRSLNEAALWAPVSPNGSIPRRFPSGISAELARLLGYVAGSGPVRPPRTGSAPGVSILATDPETVEDARELVRSLFDLEPSVETRRAPRSASARGAQYLVRVSDRDVAEYFESNFPEVRRAGERRRIPGGLFHASEACRAEFLRGAVRAAGSPGSARAGIRTSSAGLARDFADLLLSLRIRSDLRSSGGRAPARARGPAHRVVPSGPEDRRRFLALVGAERYRSDRRPGVPTPGGPGAGDARREGPPEAEGPIRGVRIRTVERIPNPGDPWVYDVTVEPTHTFVTEGMVLHNTVSIAKAGITATLNARCPVLAAANPKWGRFTNDRTIAEQIDLPPTLLSRFDVIFSIKDLPNQERDRRLAAGILTSHREGESRAYSGPEAPAASAAPFPPELLKKYIAYAKRTVHPVLSDAAFAALSDYYVKVRAQGEEPNAPVPITARQLEALIRLSEAAAKARLSPEVGVEDAQRAIQIMQNFLKRVAMTEGGKLDVDLVQSGVSHSQRERLDIVLRVMRELQDRPEATFSVEEYLEAADRAGVPANRAEALLQTLRNQGEIIESRPNRLQLVRF